jgi:putative flippase GtrA
MRHGKDLSAVTFVRGLFERVRHLIHELAKFGVVGAAGFVVTEVGFNLLHFTAGLGLFTANVLATGTAAVVTFVGNKYWTFRHRSGRGTGRETVMFFVLNGVGALIQYACVWIARNGLDVTDKYLLNVAFLIGIGLGTLFRFWSYRKWVWGFAAQEAPAEPAPRSPASV